MRVSGDWLTDPRTQAVMACLVDAGFQALVVGGCVRNALLGAPVHDIDIATDARPETVSELGESAGFKVVPTGIEHGTVTVVADHVPHEITTFRRDVETDGRRAVVAFSTEIADDARRRDFTMNALYARADGTVVDPLGGLPDLLERRVRFIEDAAERLREDYLRALRFFRFNAWYGDPAQGFDPEALEAIAAHLDGLDGLSRERVGAELLKLLAAPDPAPAVATMRQLGVLMRLLPGCDDTALAVLVHLEQQVGIAPDALRRLALLGGEGLKTRLRLSKAQSTRTGVLRDLATEGMGPAETAYRHGAETARDAALLRAALMGQLLPPQLEAEIATGAAAQFPVKPADLMPDHAGPALGRKLAALESAWIASGFRATRDDLLND
ncbi:CCA tRNA nucleotidyltransferase [Mesobacterium pallidum]|uniref:CCA tRNA nucleotidyltransferase n=1 Tax=Mesobacterium pallidum TaxID=2872037 RepID=UPI001EE2631C|nr:CCA tRNA nucleotidyltransferase [Mesobacterium pallidum]